MKKILLTLCLAITPFLAFSATFDQRNATAGCDSTCSTGSTPPPSVPSSFSSSKETRDLACDAGFTGNITQTRIKSVSNGNTSYTNWTETSNTCTCAPTTEIRNGVCPTGQNGTLTEKRNWNCSSASAGSWGSWTTATSTCASPPPPQPPCPWGEEVCSCRYIMNNQCVTAQTYNFFVCRTYHPEPEYPC